MHKIEYNSKNMHKIALFDGINIHWIKINEESVAKNSVD